jgi:putative Mg2+ transporter-C (MgtC) family protein
MWLDVLGCRRMLGLENPGKERGVMQTLSVADFALRLAVGVGCGALIGLERQWRARLAGLRTNALVAAGATLFVLYAVATEDSSPTRVASYVVSGIGFLGGGVILREGFNVRGLNTAATLWCSAAVGVLAASGHLVFTLIGTGTVVAIHLFGRPLGRLIDHDNTVEEDESLQPYLVQVICRPKSEKYARAQIVQHASSNDITLRGIHTGHAANDEITLSAHLLMDGHTPAKLERLVAELSLQPGVRAVQWYAGDKAQQSE